MITSGIQKPENLTQLDASASALIHYTTSGHTKPGLSARRVGIIQLQYTTSGLNPIYPLII